MLTKRDLFTLRTSGLSLIILLLITSEAISQERYWKLNFFSFFDNTEFNKTTFQIPQTMSGLIVAPEVGLGWDSVHRVNLGLSLVHEFGSVNAVDYYYPTAYYELNRKPYRFIMGAFPRNYAIEKYPRIFFQDSISYYRPNINGIFWEMAKDQNYINLWLDWTGRQAAGVREAFFIGFSGRIRQGILYGQHFGYMYHYASRMDPVVHEPLHDNILLLTSVGVDLAGKTIFSKLETDAGWVAGLERSREFQAGWIKQNGLLINSKIEYRIFGLYNTFYKGRGIMHFYNDHDNLLYWGDPVYRANTYNRSDIILNFLADKKVNISLIYSLHFVESSISHEQVLKVSVDLNNYQSNRGKSRSIF